MIGPTSNQIHATCRPCRLHLRRQDSGSRLTITTVKKAEEVGTVPMPPEFGDDYELLEELRGAGWGSFTRPGKKA